MDNAKPMNSIFSGLALTTVIALSVSFISANLGGPAMLYALLFGMTFNFLADHERLDAGIQFASRNILRFGVALLGFRITIAGVESLGWPVLIIIVASVLLAIFFGWAIARLCGLRNHFAILTSTAVAICGASAALAVASVLPESKNKERNTTLTVAGVTTLSTIAMILYPALVTSIDLSDITAGVFLGATIHDVAQVVGAGYIISDVAGDTSTIVKLLRVSFLIPIVIAISVFSRSTLRKNQDREPLVPLFLIGFIFAFTVNSLGWVPVEISTTLERVSSWCLLIGVAAVGIRSSIQSLAAVGMAPVIAMTLQTLCLAIIILIGIMILGFYPVTAGG